METLQKVQVKKCVPQLRFPEFEGEWEKNRLGNIGSIKMCKRIFSNETTEIGDIPFFKIGTFGKIPDAFISKELYEKYKKLFSFPRKGEILISAAGTIGRIVVYDGKPAYFQDSNIVWIENNEKLVSNSFLYFIYQIVKYDTEGGTIQRLYNGIISKTSISIPTLPEQQKIASFLSALDEKIQLLTRKKEALEQYKKGVMRQLFSQKLRFKNENGQHFPDWEEKKLGEVIQLQSGFAFKSELFSDFGQKLVTPKNFTQNGFGNFTEQYTKHTIETCDEKYICKPGDLLLLLTDLTQSCELLGKPLLVKAEDGTLLLNQRVVKVLKKNNVEVYFLQYFFQTDEYCKRIKETSSGSTVRHSSNKIILETTILLPSIVEQKKIASFLSGIDDKLAATNQQINRIQTFKKGLLQQLFV